ncbi:MAG: 1-deoxy-D-xylulose-5-phosphate synthase, partial [Peptococcaceae bacterium]
NLIVVLNDNEMSIAHNVGALAGYLSRLRTNPKYFKGKEEFEQLLRKIPAGSILFRVAERLKDSFKYLVVPGMFFEEMGFIYLGPIDGHNLKAMISVFQQVKSIKGPVLVHVVTKKGKGYKFAESCPDRFHGIGPFDVTTGKAVEDNGAPPSYTEVFGRAIVKLAESDGRIVAITAAMTEGTGLKQFARLFPGRFFDVGIAEQHAVTLAAGLAAGGYRPVVAVYSTFLQRAYDQVLHDVCLQRLPVTLAIDRAGIVGEDGATHQGLYDFAYLRHIPNMVLMAPKDENELQNMLATAVSCTGPVAVRYPRRRGVGCLLEDNFEILPLGRAEVLLDGKDVTLLAVGSMVEVARKAAELLANKGIQAAVINARFVKPLDEECILSYAVRTGRLFAIEEHALQGGFGSAVLELLADKGLTGIQVKRFGMPDTFVEHGAQQILLAKYGLTAENLTRTVCEELSGQDTIKKLERKAGTRW